MSIEVCISTEEKQINNSQFGFFFTHNFSMSKKEFPVCHPSTGWSRYFQSASNTVHIKLTWMENENSKLFPPLVM